MEKFYFFFMNLATFFFSEKLWAEEVCLWQGGGDGQGPGRACLPVADGKGEDCDGDAAGDGLNDEDGDDDDGDGHNDGDDHNDGDGLRDGDADDPARACLSVWDGICIGFAGLASRLVQPTDIWQQSKMPCQYIKISI